IRTTDLYGFIRIPFFRRMAVEIMREASGILFLSLPHKEELFERYLNIDERKMVDEKSVIIGNALENFWINHIAKERNYDINPQNLRILSVAKIRSIKNLSIAAMAVEEL